MDRGMTPECRELDEIKDIVTCAICLELYDNPCILSCSHTYCFMCLYALCEESSPTEHIKCPQCRQHTIPPPAALDQLPSNVFANRLVSLVRQRAEGAEVEGKFAVSVE